jgi:predicted RNA-binding Zn ribbon-like protein
MTAHPNPHVFSLCGGHPVLDLVNTLDFRFRSSGPIELLPSYGALLNFMEQSGLLDRATHQMLATEGEKAERALDSARELREAAASVLYAVVEGSTPPREGVRTLELGALDAQRHQELRWEPSATDSKFVWNWRPPEIEADLPARILALQASALLTSAALSHVNWCHSDSCRWLFLDTSKNHTRRWCNMKVCGNRMKARRFQARRA